MPIPIGMFMNFTYSASMFTTHTDNSRIIFFAHLKASKM